jgi:hypothetical protein
MNVYRLHRDTEVLYVRSTPDRMRARMWEYIREQRAKGLQLGDIIFCWTPIQISTI